MASQGIQVKGLRETVRKMERLGVEVKDLKAAFTRIGTTVSTEARSRAPKLTGALAGSIRPSNTKNKSVVRAGTGRIPYAGVIHFGWPGHGISPQPFLYEALDAKQDEVVRQLETELGSLIRRINL